MLPASKKVMAIMAVSKTNGATAGGELIPTKGFKFADIDVGMDMADVVSNAPSVLKLQEADVTNASSFVDVSGFVGGTDFVIGNAFTSTTLGQNLWNMRVDLKKRKAYLRLQVVPRTTNVIFGVANLHRGETTPTNAAQVGVIATVDA